MVAYFGPKMTRDTLDLLLNWGPIIGVVVFYPQTKLAQQKGGFRRGCWIGIFLVLLGNIVRCIPIVLAETSAATSFVQSNFAFVCYHTGQILIAAAGPFFMGTVTALSQIWFLENERTTATAIATTANALGTTVGFLNPQWLTLSPAQVPNLFYFSLILALVPLFCALLYLPEHPPEPPSYAAALSRELKADNIETGGGTFMQPPDVSRFGGDDSRDTDRAQQSWLVKLTTAASNRSFTTLVIAASVLSGVQSGWGSLFQSILGPAGISSAGVSWIGFGNGFAQNCGAILSGWIVDKFFTRRLKFGIILGLTGCLLSTGWFTVLMWGSSTSAHPPEWQLVLALCISGLFNGATTPLFYELSAELIYPIKEGVSAGILVMLLNATSCVTIFLNNIESGSSMNAIMTACVGAVLLCVLCFIKEDYRRPQNARADP